MGFFAHSKKGWGGGQGEEEEEGKRVLLPSTFSKKITLFTKSQNYKVVEVERDLWESFGPTSLLNQAT